jgi:hypothetical protein
MELLNAESNPSGLSKVRKFDVNALKHEFYKALRSVEQTDHINYMEQAIRASLKDNNLRIAILKKLLPDLSETEIGVNLINVVRHLDDKDKIDMINQDDLISKDKVLNNDSDLINKDKIVDVKISKEGE